MLGDLTIAEDVREFYGNLILHGEFNFTSDLAPETVEEAEDGESTKRKSTLDGLLDASKCNGGAITSEKAVEGGKKKINVGILLAFLMTHLASPTRQPSPVLASRLVWRRRPSRRRRP